MPKKSPASGPLWATGGQRLTAVANCAKSASRDFLGTEKRVSAVLVIASPRRIKATHRRRRKVTAGHVVQRYYDPGVGRFLSIDPVATSTNSGKNFSRYWYANNSPLRFTDPDGRYGNDGSFTDVQWRQFERSQTAAATRVDAAIVSLRSAISDPTANSATVRGFETAFGRGSFTHEGASRVLASLQGISSALHSDGSAATGGYLATRISTHGLSKLMKTDAKNIAAAGVVGGTTMYVNSGHKSASNGDLRSDILIHEAGHNGPASMQDQYYGPNNDKAYNLGTEAEQEAYKGLKSTGRAIVNPDNYVEFAQ
jgi:RHS repeat-associated protein